MMRRDVPSRDVRWLILIRSLRVTVHRENYARLWLVYPRDPLEEVDVGYLSASHTRHFVEGSYVSPDR